MPIPQGWLLALYARIGKLKVCDGFLAVIQLSLMFRYNLPSVISRELLFIFHELPSGLFRRACQRFFHNIASIFGKERCSGNIQADLYDLLAVPVPVLSDFQVNFGFYDSVKIGFQFSNFFIDRFL